MLLLMKIFDRASNTISRYVISSIKQLVIIFSAGIHCHLKDELLVSYEVHTTRLLSLSLISS